MNKIYLFIFAVITLVPYGAHAQDLNITNSRYFPLYINPAGTGHFLGTLRLGGNLRGQDSEFMTDGYRTASVFLDATSRVALRKYDWTGFGIQLYHDDAGTLPLTTTGILMSASYHFSFDKKYRNVLSIGAQYGTIQKKIDPLKLVLESDATGTGNKDRPFLTDYKSSTNDLNAGIMFRSMLTESKTLTMGLSVYHILQPYHKGIKSSNVIDRRYTLHSSLLFDITKNVSMQSRIILSKSGFASNFMFQDIVFFKLDKKKNNDNMIYAGIGYRLQDALQIMAGIRYKGIDVGIAYDLTVSDKAQYNRGMGGLEIGFYKIFNIRHKPKVTPVLLCPEKL